MKIKRLFSVLILTLVFNYCGEGSLIETFLDVKDVKINETVTDLKEIQIDINHGDVLNITCQTDEDCIQQIGSLGPCQLVWCDSSIGKCVSGSKKNYSICDDNNVCTTETYCVDGECKVFSEKNCDDGNECTDDSCDPEKGCVFTNNNNSCDDGDPCTVNDTCKDGVCAGEPTESCGCEKDEDCVKLDDDNLCNGIMKCIDGKCKIDPDTVVTCSDPIENDCITYVCDEKTGNCIEQKVADGLKCDDGNSCTVGDFCKDGACVSEANICDCETDEDCKEKDDGNLCNGVLKCVENKCVIDPDSIVKCEESGKPCYENICNPETGKCEEQMKEDGSSCDDGNICTYNDQCLNGECKGKELNCLDDDPCTKDYCDPEKGCTYECVCSMTCTTDADCDDGNLCTKNSCEQIESEKCPGSKCVSVEIDCDDGNLCTADSCDPEKGCVHEPVVTCEPSDNPCVENVCNPETGQCEPVNKDGILCEDGNLCTVNDVCQGGVCTSGEEVVCDSTFDTECRKNVCNKETGMCEFQNVNEGKPCDDNNLCTQGDKCVNGECIADSYVQCEQPGGMCEVSVCNPETGKCEDKNAPDGTECDDGNPCTTSDICISGQCVGTGETNCDDNDLCTTDFCDEQAGGCVHEPVDCNDNNECTIDSCVKEKGCVYEDVTCPPSTECAVSICDPKEGCKMIPIDGKSCDDSNPCTVNDVCKNGECVGENICECETDKDCLEYDDGNLCNGVFVCQNGKCVVDPDSVVTCDSSNDTDCMKNQCNPETGECEMKPVEDGTECDDSNMCTTGDYCKKGECISESSLDCDDGNLCTNDSCNPDAGCIHTKIDCDDNNLCTNDYCVPDKGCVHDKINCDDGNECTDDSCDPEKGCLNIPNTNSCDDGNPCTINDSCSDGKCTGIYVCECTTDDDCKQYEDDNLCNGTLICQNGYCVVDPDTIVKCDSSNDTQCLKNTCIPETGQCEMKPVENGTACDDGNICTINDYCKEGKCISDETIDCNDNNLCTDDSCNPANGCEYTPHDCDDGNLCTKDSCNPETGCEYETKVCDDGNSCTKDSCNPETGECVFVNLDGVSCDDGNACTEGETCSEGKCGGGKNVCCVPGKKIGCDKLDFGDTFSSNPLTTEVIDSYDCPGATKPFEGYKGSEFTYAFTSKCTGKVTITVQSSPLGELNSDVLLDVFVLKPGSNGECFGNQCIAYGLMENEIPGPIAIGTAKVVFDATKDETYYIVIDGRDGKEGGFIINTSCNCAKEICDNNKDDDGDNLIDCDDPDCKYFPSCMESECLPYKSLKCGDNLFDNLPNKYSTNNIDFYPECVKDEQFNWKGPENTYKFIPKCTGSATVVVNSLGGLIEPPMFDVFILKDNNGKCESENCVAYGLMKIGGGPVPGVGEAKVTFEATAGEVYYVVVDGRSGAVGQYTVNITCQCGGTTETNCADGIDNDGDNLTDCFDPDCTGKTCDDKNLCTENDVCTTYGMCLGKPKNCNDSNICTTDFCDPQTGECIHKNNNLPCDDGNECTVGDMCSNGECKGGEDICCCCESFGSTLKCGDEINGDLFNKNTTDSISKYKCSKYNYKGPEFSYVFIPTCTGEVTVTLSAALFGKGQLPPLFGYMDVMIMTDKCDGNQCIAAGLMKQLGGIAKVSFEAEKGKTYYITVDGRNGFQGNYLISVSCSCTTKEICDNEKDDDGDNLIDCDDPDCKFFPDCLNSEQKCSPSNTLECGSNIPDLIPSNNSTKDISYYPCFQNDFFDYSGFENVYEFTAKCTGSAEITVTSGFFVNGGDESIPPQPVDAFFDIFVIKDEEGKCSNQNCIAYGLMKKQDIGIQPGLSVAKTSFQIQKNNKYYVVVEGRNNSKGSYFINVSCFCIQ